MALSLPDLEKMSVKELLKTSEALGLKSAGLKKTQIVSRIVVEQLHNPDLKTSARVGRPTGRQATQVKATAKLSQCPKCQSTEREPYLNRTEQAIVGFDTNGNKYTHIVRRRCQCVNCGQIRIDMHKENRVKSESRIKSEN